MVIAGEIKNGVVVLPADTHLPEGTKVQVVVNGVQQPALGSGLMPFAGICDELPPDASENVDHYLYGHPRR